MLVSAPRYVVPAVALIAAMAFVAGGPRAAASPRPARRRPALTANPAFTLRSVDARCFYAPGGAARGWPWGGQGPFPIRGSFNEVRALVGSHFGVDVSAPRDQAEVDAIASGTVRDRTKHTLTVSDTPGHRWIYWHLQSTARWRRDMHVARRRVLGSTIGNYWHVHISEWVKGCGYVDPRRPTGNFWNPANTQTPMLGALSAFAADREAFARPPSVGAAPPPDPATPERLDDLHGIVDLRTTAMVAGPDTLIAVVGGTTHIPDLAVSAIRSWLTTPARPHDHLELRTVMDGSRLVSNPNLWHKWAWGTWRDNGCFYGNGACSQTMVWHVAGQRGLDTRSYPNGRYLYCVGALSIDDRANTRCTDVTISN